MTYGLVAPAGGFGGYLALSTATSAQNKTDINANLDRLSALLQVEGPSNATSGAGDQPVYPEFGQISPEIAALIKAEIVALKAIVTASP